MVTDKTTIVIKLRLIEGWHEAGEKVGATNLILILRMEHHIAVIS